MENLTKILSRLPIVVLAAFYCGYLYYDHNDWLTSKDSELGQKKAQVVIAKTDLDAQKKKLATGEEFFKNLDALRERIRALTDQLASTKTSLSADIDIANFVRIVTLEVKRLGFQIKGIKPELEKKNEYYVEVPFSVSLRGTYIHFMVFFDRVAKFQQVIRISDFKMSPTSNNLMKYVELDAEVKLVAYRYLGSAADDILAKDSMKGKEREQWNKGN
ncbi:MAG: type 4a pilus biogenesis protein PilO [Deltaproteobacteria bacterium]|nr:type 4a pilus biogenesis protein PilO [Deltaproteobacteria bacterium]